jgi:hypothetical protein
MTNEDLDTSTYFDASGVERWTDNKQAINQNSPFRRTSGGFALEVAKMAENAHRARGVSRAISRERARGIDRASIRDMGNIGQLRAIDERQTTAYGKAKAGAKKPA